MTPRVTFSASLSLQGVLPSGTWSNHLTDPIRHGLITQETWGRSIPLVGSPLIMFPLTESSRGSSLVVFSEHLPALVMTVFQWLWSESVSLTCRNEKKPLCECVVCMHTHSRIYYGWHVPILGHFTLEFCSLQPYYMFTNYKPFDLYSLTSSRHHRWHNFSTGHATVDGRAEIPVN